MAKPHEIIDALTERLEDADFPVFQGLVLDPKVDSSQELPAVIIHQSKDGDGAIRTRPKLLREMGVIVECWIQTTSEKKALSEILEYGEEVREAVAPFDSFDVPDTLSDIANAVEFVSIVSYVQERNWAVAVITLKIQYGG